MRQILILLAVCGASSAEAALLHYDGFEPVSPDPATEFNYRPGEPLAPRDDTTGTPHPGQLVPAPYNVNWRYVGGGAAATNNAPTIASGSLSYSGLYPSTGNKVAFDMTQIASSRVQVASAINSGTVYWSGIIQVSALGATMNTVNGLLLGGFNNTPGPGTTANAVGAVLRLRKDPTDNSMYNIGTAMNSGTGAGNIQWSGPFAPSSTDTIFLVGAYEFVAGSNNDIARMWINPSVSTFGAGTAPAATLTSAPGGSIADSFASISTFNLRNVNTVGTVDALFDELRVGDDWASVTVPEPSLFWTLALLGALRPGRSRREYLLKRTC
jgi:hypothetical protein